MSDQSHSQQAEDCAKGLLMPENRHSRIRLAALAGVDVLATAWLILLTWNEKAYSLWGLAASFALFCAVIATAEIRRRYWMQYPSSRMTYFQTLLSGLSCTVLALLMALMLIYRVNTHIFRLLVAVFAVIHLCLQLYNYWQPSRNDTANQGSS